MISDDAVDRLAQSTGSLIQVLDDAIRDPLDRLQKAQTQLARSVRQLSRGLADGNLRDMASLISAVTEKASRLQEALATTRQAFEDFVQLPTSDQAYIEEFEAACRLQRLCLEGSFPAYEVFPFEVQFHLDDRYVLVNNRTVPILRPTVLAAYIAKVRDQLYREAFNARRFRLALLKAWEILADRRAPNGAVPLRAIHELLALRQGTGPSGYSLKQFAFDIFRVRREGLIEGNRRLVFIHGRSSRNAVVVPVAGGEAENLVALQVQEVS